MSNYLIWLRFLVATVSMDPKMLAAAQIDPSEVTNKGRKDALVLLALRVPMTPELKEKLPLNDLRCRESRMTIAEIDALSAAFVRLYEFELAAEMIAQIPCIAQAIAIENERRHREHERRKPWPMPPADKIINYQLPPGAAR
ncbi:hypothetical protein SBBP2_1590010 [Burkholderiales bacterium]|jgi:hypothetical protein|nr:hypothetical protein SBBP2_1590010 [Burkholderiales bacterium]